MNFQAWFKRRVSPTNPQQLNSKTIYIFPSLYGFCFGVMLGSIFIASINYQLAAAFFLTFMLVGIGLLTMLQSHNNLKGLTIQLMGIEDASLNDVVRVKCVLKTNHTKRFAVTLKVDQQKTLQIEALQDSQELILPIATTARGRFKLPRIEVLSYYPLGLYRVWGYLYFDAHYYVYPKKVTTEFWPEPQGIHSGSEQQAILTVVGDELLELKSVSNPWAEKGKIAWKKVAMGQGWFIKEMASTGQQAIIFSLKTLPGDIEHRLSQLAYLIEKADRMNMEYGLELGSHFVDANKGVEHCKRLLRLLACYEN